MSKSNVAIAIGQSYIDEASGDVVAAVAAHSDSAADILIAHIAKGDPQLAERLGEALEI